MTFLRVFRMWFRILRRHGFNRRQAWQMAWSLSRPTVNAIDEHGGLE